jgi:hypothetical protein
MRRVDELRAIATPVSHSIFFARLLAFLCVFASTFFGFALDLA